MAARAPSTSISSGTAEDAPAIPMSKRFSISVLILSQVAVLSVWFSSAAVLA